MRIPRMVSVAEGELRQLFSLIEASSLVIARHEQGIILTPRSIKNFQAKLQDAREVRDRYLKDVSL